MHYHQWCKKVIDIGVAIQIVFCTMFNGAEKLKLQEIADIRPGYPFRKRIAPSAGGEVAVVQIKNLDEFGSVDWTNVVRTSLPGKRKADWLKDSDILFAARGTRNLAWCLRDVIDRAVCSPHFFSLRINHSDTDPRFVAWYLNQGPAQKYFAVSGSGAVVNNIRRDVLQSTVLIIPPLEKQLEIVALDSVIKHERKNLEKRIENGRAMSNAIAQDLFDAQR